MQIISTWDRELERKKLLGSNYFSKVREEYLASHPHKAGFIYAFRSKDQVFYSADVDLSSPIVLFLIEEEFNWQNQQIQDMSFFLSSNHVVSKSEPILLGSSFHSLFPTTIQVKRNGFNLIFPVKKEFSRALITEQKRGGNADEILIDRIFYTRNIFAIITEDENLWLYQDSIYSATGKFSVDDTKLLILEHADKERQKFEHLKNKFSSTQIDDLKFERVRIPEAVRVAVWRRDQGKCARCGSRENLEYDHIVPVSKGGSNTERNIELLCQSCNRAKGNRIE